MRRGYLTPREAAIVAGVSVGTIYRWLHEGIPVIGNPGANRTIWWSYRVGPHGRLVQAPVARSFRRALRTAGRTPLGEERRSR